ncbi:LemA family protein [Pleionea sediminis]|uniref:LemA family protein n=1 Tax=Pleionea sediminis TaxID=2569479 RepID=UPI001186F4B7|nr:LemA family protein [Pleionea sediminis]
MLLHGSVLQKVLFGLLTVILAIVGWWLTQSGFAEIKSLRQIERLPTSQVAAALEGDVKLQVSVESFQETLVSEYFKQPSVYYRYRYEEEETDSDGNTYWDTKFIHTDSKNFYASDASGKVLIRTQSNPDIEFSLPVSQQLTSGTTRHTEWRIERGDRLFILGQIEIGSSIPEVDFWADGSILPLISKFDESEEKSGIGTSVIIKVCGGMSLFALAALCLVITLGIHRILAFLIILTLSVVVPLVEHGLVMLNDDISQTERMLQQRNQQLIEKLVLLSGDEGSFIREHFLSEEKQDDSKRLSDINSELMFDWSRISEAINQLDLNDSSFDQTLIDTAFLQQQFNRQITPFPNNVIAWWRDVKEQSLYEWLPNELQIQVNEKLAQFQTTKTSGFLSNLIVICGALLCVGFTWFGFRLIRLKRHIENLPTSKTTGLMFGLSELKGRVKFLSEMPMLEAPLTSKSCCWYRYIIEEKQGSGKDKEWVTIEDITEHTPFVCQDPFGKVKVNPQSAEVISNRKKVQRRGDRRYTEYRVQLNDKLYLIGPAQVDVSSGDTLEIRHDQQSPFLITNETEDAIMYRKAYGGMLSLTVAFAALMFGALFLLGASGSFAPIDYLIAALIAPTYMLVLILIFHYNDLVFLRQRATRNYANIEVSMQKRFDLIPNLQSIVERFMEHERKLLKAIVKLRKALNSNALKPDTLGEVVEYEQKVVSSVIARVERYPDLKANALAKKLMNNLVDLENEIALMREGYNDAVEYYNTRILSVPDVFYARLFGFKELSLLNFETKKFKRISF